MGWIIGEVLARIRSIKPEFWTDEKTANLPEATALFFIGLWTHSDDYGFFPSSSRALSLLLPRYRSQVVEPMLRRLEKDGLVRVSRGTGVGVVVGWEHQRIKDKRASKWNGVEIEWDIPQPDTPRSRKNGPGVECIRSGVEWSGSTSEVLPPEDAPPAENVFALTEPKPNRQVANPDGDSPTAITWRAYRDAYAKRHGSAPPWNSKQAGMLKSFTQRVPASEAPLVAAFYVGHQDGYYVRARHPLGLLLRDAEKLHTDWKTGTQQTGTTVRLGEKVQHAKSQLERIARGEL